MINVDPQIADILARGDYKELVKLCKHMDQTSPEYSLETGEAITSALLDETLETAYTTIRNLCLRNCINHQIGRVDDNDTRPMPNSDLLYDKMVAFIGSLTDEQRDDLNKRADLLAE